MIIGIHGKKGSGKSTVADMMVSLSDRSIWPAMFAQKIKDMVGVLVDMTPEELEDRDIKEKVIPGVGFSPRDLMQTLGTEWGRNMDEDFWVKILMREYDRSIQVYPNCVWAVVDCRFENECKAIRDRGGKLIKIVRRGIETTDTHPSEMALDNWTDWDYIIENNFSKKHLQTDAAAVLKYCGL